MLFFFCGWKHLGLRSNHEYDQILSLDIYIYTWFKLWVSAVTPEDCICCLKKINQYEDQYGTKGIIYQKHCINTGPSQYTNLECLGKRQKPLVYKKNRQWKSQPRKTPKEEPVTSTTRAEVKVPQSIAWRRLESRNREIKPQDINHSSAVRTRRTD